MAQITQLSSMKLTSLDFGSSKHFLGTSYDFFHEGICMLMALPCLGNVDNKLYIFSRISASNPPDVVAAAAPPVAGLSGPGEWEVHLGTLLLVRQHSSGGDTSWSLSST